MTQFVKYPTGRNPGVTFSASGKVTARGTAEIVRSKNIWSSGGFGNWSKLPLTIASNSSTGCGGGPHLLTCMDQGGIWQSKDDALTWSRVYYAGGGNMRLLGWDGTNYIIDDGTYRTSPTGDSGTWTTRNATFHGFYTGARGILNGKVYEWNGTTLKESTNYGASWNTYTLPISVQNVGYGNGRYLCGGYQSTTIYWSDDLVTWNSVNVGVAPAYEAAFAYGNGVYVAGGSYGGRNMWSEDGINWVNTNGAFQIPTFIPGPNIFLSRDSNGSSTFYYYSSNGKRWQVLNMDNWVLTYITGFSSRDNSDVVYATVGGSNTTRNWRSKGGCAPYPIIERTVTY